MDQNSSAPVPKVLNTAIAGMVTTFLVWLGSQYFNTEVAPETAGLIAGLVVTGLGFAVGYLTPQQHKAAEEVAQLVELLLREYPAEVNPRRLQTDRGAVIEAINVLSKKGKA